jgi:hypothetical protein
LDIIADYSPGEPRHQAAIRDAALAPKLHAELWDQYGAEMPADIEVRRFLIRGRNFYDRAADKFIREYKATLEFAGLNGPAGLLVEPDRAVADTAPLADDGSHAFAEDSSTGLPIHQRSVVQPLSVVQSQPHVIPESPVEVGMRKDVLTLDEGEVVLHTPKCLSASNYEVMEESLIVVLRKVWGSIEDAEGSTPRPRVLSSSNTPRPLEG